MGITNIERQPNVLTLSTSRNGCVGRQKPQAFRVGFDIDDETIATLRQAVITRQVEEGAKWIEQHHAIVEVADPEHRNAAPLTGWISQWVEMSDYAYALLRKLLLLFPPSARSSLPLNSYLHLRMADGIVKLSAGNDHDAAAAHFDFIISLEHESIDRELPALAHFWKARCERERGNSDLALVHASRARTLSAAMGSLAGAAMAQVVEACIYIDKGRFGRAIEILREADLILQHTTDWTWRGNLQSAYGRMALEEGRYKSALEKFTSAVSLYKRCNVQHRQLPDVLVSLAHSQRLFAARMAKAVDTQLERRRKEKAGSGAPEQLGTRHDVEELRRHAFANLSDAIQRRDSHPSLVIAYVERGLLFIDCGQYDRASLDAEQAFQLASQTSDRTAIAHALLLHSRIEKAQFDEGVGDAPAQHAQRAHDYARDALTYATQTEDRRLLASVYICQGLILSSDVFNNMDAASECCAQASHFLTAGNCNELWDEHQALTRKLARQGNVDSRLREWSQGLVTGKTFQQLTEEFAELVIPSVWEREGRNVSRVVAKLSISPKKVRRILTNAGFKTGVD